MITLMTFIVIYYKRCQATKALFYSLSVCKRSGVALIAYQRACVLHALHNTLHDTLHELKAIIQL